MERPLPKEESTTVAPSNIYELLKQWPNHQITFHLYGGYWKINPYSLEMYRDPDEYIIGSYWCFRTVDTLTYLMPNGQNFQLSLKDKDTIILDIQAKVPIVNFPRQCWK